MESLFRAILGSLVFFLFVFGCTGLYALVRGSRHLRQSARALMPEAGDLLLKSPMVPSVSVVASVSDATPSSREFVRGLLDLHYGTHELVLVLDGLSETDLELWKQAFHLSVSARNAETVLPSARIRCLYEPRDPVALVVVAKERGGEADSLNAGLNVARYELIARVERGCRPEPDALLRLVQPFLEEPGQTIAACGAEPAPAARSLAGRIGALEAFRFRLAGCGWLAGRNRLARIPAGCLLARRDAIARAGGFRRERLELLSCLHGSARAAGKPYRIVFLPDRLSHAPGAGSLPDLRQSVSHDQEEIAATLRRQGLRAAGLPSLCAARLARPVVETAAYLLTAGGLALGWVDSSFALLVALATIGVGMLQSMAAVVLHEVAADEPSAPGQLAGLFFTAIPENCGYRQLRNLWMIAGFRASEEKAGI